MKAKVGIVGCGTIGSLLAKAIETRLGEKAHLAAICDIDQIRIDNLLSKIKVRPDVCSLKELIRVCDFVIEAASKDISGEVAKAALSAKKNVLIMSVGGLLENVGIFDLARKNKARLYIPSGALAGLDALKAAILGRIDRVTLTTRKAPRALEGAPYLKEKEIDISSVKEEKTIFEGTVSDAVRGFPKNINVAAIVGLLCGGMAVDKIRIRIVAVPGSNANTHQLEAQGEFGRLIATTENVPSPDNPKTSYLAALSAIATLEGALDNVRIGT
jgi:aspartate dehydrogenase